MAFVVEDGSGLPNATSLCSVAEADAVLELRLHTDAWDGADDPTKEAALAWMSRVLTRLKWKGTRTWPGQALCFPRAYLVKFDSSLIPPLDYYPSDEVPLFVKEATTIGAMRLIEGDPAAGASSTGLYKRLKLDVLEVEYNPGITATGATIDDVDTEVEAIIGFALVGDQLGAVGARPTVRV